MSTDSSSPASAALEGREDLTPYGSNRLLLYALELHFGLEDIHTTAATVLTDGPNDKKCDLIYVDAESGHAVIAQSYMSEDPSRAAAQASKASDLNAALAWILGQEREKLPEALRSAIEELDDALREGHLHTLELWYCHNLPESSNVQDELRQVEVTAHSLLDKFYSNAGIETVAAIEVGRNTLDEWYKSSQTPILVTEQFDIAIHGGFRTSGDNWEAFTTTVPGEWLGGLYQKHKERLFSPNVRDYLGSRRSDRNINNNIKDTAKHTPERFWVYNNGLTALVNDFSVSEDESGGERLTISGIGIVNGAQTTGAIGSVDDLDATTPKVMARFVKCSTPETVRDIIRFNNSQNRVEAADFRSNDPIQDRLRTEFTAVPGAEYRGGRRGGAEDKIKRPADLLPSNTVAQALAAFHLEPNIAYNQKSRIWQSDEVYSQFFSEKTTARHILLAYGLLRAVQEKKLELLGIPEEEKTEAQKAQVEFFRQRGSTFLLVAAIAASLETILGRAIPNPWALKFGTGTSPGAAERNWVPIVRALLAFVAQLEQAVAINLKNKTIVDESIERFRSLVEATRDSNSAVYESFAGQLDLT